MGLDMYLSKTKRINNASIRDIIVANAYLDYMAVKDKEDYSMKEWCGIEASEVNKEIVEAIKNDFLKRNYLWDKEDKYGYFSTIIEIGYWRKQNAIHKWFVDNVQNGVDDCEAYEVTKENIEQLLDLCKKVKNGEDPKELLPCQSGFFFGSTEYDEWYMKGIEDTIETLENVLRDTNFEHEIVFYQSSW